MQGRMRATQQDTEFQTYSQHMLTRTGLVSCRC